MEPLVILIIGVVAVPSMIFTEKPLSTISVPVTETSSVNGRNM